MNRFTEIPPEKLDRNYPYFGKNILGIVVLFVSPRAGYVINQGTSTYSMGELVKCWKEDLFKPISGRLDP